MKKEPQNPLFRQVALENKYHSQLLNERIQIISAKNWVVATAVFLFLISLFIWGIFGVIPIRVNGKGILLAGKGSLYNAVAPEGSGRLVRIAVKPGDVVRRGQVVAYLDTPDLEEKYQVALKFLTRLQEEYQQSLDESKKEIKQRKANLSSQNKTLQQSLKAEQEHLEKISELLKIQRTSFAKGIATRQDILNTENNFYATKSSLSTIQDNLIQNKIEIKNFISQWNDKLRNLELKIIEQQHAVDDLNASMSISKEVKSPVDGIITQIQATLGEKLAGGDSVVTISTKQAQLESIVYIPAAEGKRVKVGMTVLISPSTVKREEFGSMQGKVTYVSSFPSTEKAMLAILQNRKLVESFSEKGAPIAVRVQLKLNPHHISGYEWTSSEGPDMKISAGTLVEALITVKKQRPISLLLPAIKKVTGD